MTTDDIVQALVDAKGIDVKAYDVRGKSGIADYFVVATGAAAKDGECKCGCGKCGEQRTAVRPASPSWS